MIPKMMLLMMIHSFITTLSRADATANDVREYLQAVQATIYELVVFSNEINNMIPAAAVLHPPFGPPKRLCDPERVEALDDPTFPALPLPSLPSPAFPEAGDPIPATFESSPSPELPSFLCSSPSSSLYCLRHSSTSAGVALVNSALRTTCPVTGSVPTNPL